MKNCSMAGDGIRAVAASMLFIIASMVPVLNSDYLDDSEIFFNSQNFTTEVRIHDIESEWDDSEILIWYPNTPINERTFQFTVKIDGISEPEEIEFCNLTMTWQYNVSSEDHLISVTLDNNNFIEIDGDLFLVYQYQYANNIFFGDYYISLETTDINGNNYSFSHQGIEVLERGYLIDIIDNFPENKLLFANSKLTELEFQITNTGVSYSNFDILVTLETEMPPEWTEPLFYNDNVSSVWGGDSVSSSISFEAYLDLSSSPPPEKIIFHISISYEDDEGNIVELGDEFIEFISMAVPENPIPAISFFRDENRTDLFADSLSQEPLDNSVFTANGENVTIFANLSNFGFQTGSYEMEIGNSDLVEFWNFSLFSNGKKVTPDENDIYLLAVNLQPLENISLAIEINLFNSSFNLQDFSIKITEINNLEDSEVLMTLINYQITNPIRLQNTTEQNPILNIGEVLQNESFEFQVLFEFNPFFFTQEFENEWILYFVVANDLAILNSQNIVANLIQTQTQTETLPFQFSITSKSPYIINYSLNELIDIGNYSINLTLTQVSNDGESLFFERQINFTIIENASLIIENETENDGSANNNTQDNNSSNNTQNENLSNNSQNNNPDNSSNLTNNSSEIDTNNNVSESNSSEIPNQQQDNSSVTQNVDTDSSDSAKSEDSNSKSWIFVVLIVLVLTVIMIFIIQRRRPKTSSEQTNKQPISIEPIASIPVIPDMSANQLTILHQWTDANGYTWRQMSDRSVLWWNGQNWVPVNQNQ